MFIRVKTILRHILIAILLLSVQSLQAQQVVTIEGKNWMRTNLAVTKFANGDNIPHAESAEEWRKAAKSKSPAWCYYKNDPSTVKEYGVLYNYYAVNDRRGLAPRGWRVPTPLELELVYNHMINEYGLENLHIAMSLADKNAPFQSRSRWQNASGFSAYPSVVRRRDGNFSDKPEGVNKSEFRNDTRSNKIPPYWWTIGRPDNSPSDGVSDPIILTRTVYMGAFYDMLFDKATGLSVRLIRQ